MSLGFPLLEVPMGTIVDKLAFYVGAHPHSDSAPSRRETAEGKRRGPRRTTSVLLPGPPHLAARRSGQTALRLAPGAGLPRLGRFERQRLRNATQTQNLEYDVNNLLGSWQWRRTRRRAER